MIARAIWLATCRAGNAVACLMDALFPYSGSHMGRIDLPDDVVNLAEKQVAAGRAQSLEEVVRAGIEALELRDQQRYDAKLSELRAAIDEGDDSGTFEGDPFAEVRARHALPRTSP